MTDFFQKFNYFTLFIIKSYNFPEKIRQNGQTNQYLPKLGHFSIFTPIDPHFGAILDFFKNSLYSIYSPYPKYSPYRISDQMDNFWKNLINYAQTH